MVFASIVFLSVFLPVVFLVHLVVRPIRVRNLWLIAASLLFYSYGEPVYVLLMLVSSVFNWGVALAIGAPHVKSLKSTKLSDNSNSKPGEPGTPRNPETRRKILLALAVVLNLGMLATFKYAAMIADTFGLLLHTDFNLPVLALPIGISFYTFQALSYVIDVSRGKCAPNRNYCDVLLYIAFFPQLIAGPIVRYPDIAQALSNRHATSEDIALGLRRFVVGLSKKVIIADTLAVVADTIYNAPSTEIDAGAAWLAALAFMLQIYFDFSGYSDMAIGMARMFGFHYRENFIYPYVSQSIREFWRRWHRSLSSWFKEYLYIPLGGNRLGRPRAVVNKIVVFLLCGLWHGAAWTFVVWGLAHGFFLLLEEYLPIQRLPRILRHVYVLLVVLLTFVLFRADTFGQAVLMWGRMFGAPGAILPDSLALSLLDPFTVCVLVGALIAMTPVTRLVEKVAPALVSATSAETTPRPPVVFRPSAVTFVGAFVLLVFDLLLLASGGYHPFIYFRF